jgi:hypothetical protein
MTDKDMTKDETFEAWFTLIFLYFIAGTATGTFMALGGAIEQNPSAATVIGVIILWPLFVIKYLAIGIYAVLSAGFGLLV